MFVDNVAWPHRPSEVTFPKISFRRSVRFRSRQWGEDPSPCFRGRGTSHNTHGSTCGLEVSVGFIAPGASNNSHSNLITHPKNPRIWCFATLKLSLTIWLVVLTRPRIVVDQHPWLTITTIFETTDQINKLLVDLKHLNRNELATINQQLTIEILG